MIIKEPTLPSLLVGTLLGGIFAVIFQPQIITQISGIEEIQLKHLMLLLSMLWVEKFLSQPAMQ